MSLGQSIRDLFGQFEQAPQRHWATANLLAQGLAVDELGDNVRSRSFDVGFEHCQDVRVIEGAGRTCLGDEPPHAIGVGVGTLVQDFERHLAVQPRIPCAIHLSHAAAAERTADFIGRKRRGAQSRLCHVKPVRLHIRPSRGSAVAGVDRSRVRSTIEDGHIAMHLCRD